MTEKYKDIIFDGSTFPDDKYKTVKVVLNDTIKTEYLPVLEKLPYTKGLKLLMTAMTHMEGFRKGSGSYRTNNPGNVGNTDSGANKKLVTLSDGIQLQAEHLKKIAEGRSKYYPLGKQITLKPFYSPEIANNPQYGLPANLPGYKFIYTGKLDQFIKIYSTGARVTNIYINTIVSYFAQNGITITPADKLIDIIAID